jgi:hypothetical protein
MLREPVFRRARESGHPVENIFSLGPRLRGDEQAFATCAKLKK